MLGEYKFISAPSYQTKDGQVKYKINLLAPDGNVETYFTNFNFKGDILCDVVADFSVQRFNNNLSMKLLSIQAGTL